MEIDKKWGSAASAGFQQVPDILLKRQSELGLSCTDMIVLLNITMHWWYADRPPFPGTKAIATRIGITHRTVQRSLARLVKLGLLTRDGSPLGDRRASWDANGLKGQLETLAAKDASTRARRFAQMVRSETPSTGK